MPVHQDEPFPCDAARDLRGLVRAMYAAAKLRGAGGLELSRIERVGKQLTEAIELADTTRPGSLGHRAAWQCAEAATRALGELVDALTPAEPLVLAASARVLGASGPRRKPREER